jgi:ribonucleoside-diphosphate reductase alpha chain
MVCLDIDHPEIMDFISWKAKEESKAKALIKMGYDSDFEGEAYATVSGQNSNNSLRLSDEFMTKVDNLSKEPDASIELKGRIDQSVNKNIMVSELWDQFNRSAWDCADPAPQFDDTFNAWHTCPAGEDGVYNAKYNRINSTNPCGEYAFLDDTSCNLASINLFRFYDSASHTFDTDGFLQYDIRHDTSFREFKNTNGSSNNRRQLKCHSGRAVRCVPGSGDKKSGYGHFDFTDNSCDDRTCSIFKK